MVRFYSFTVSLYLNLSSYSVQVILFMQFLFVFVYARNVVYDNGLDSVS